MKRIKVIVVSTLILISVFLLGESKNIINYYGTHYAEGYNTSNSEQSSDLPPYTYTETNYHTDNYIDWFIIHGLEWVIVLTCIALWYISFKLIDKWMPPKQDAIPPTRF
jgi:hypothetical protein